jgi:hypothetical protein
MSRAPALPRRRLTGAAALVHSGSHGAGARSTAPLVWTERAGAAAPLAGVSEVTLEGPCRGCSGLEGIVCARRGLAWRGGLPSS